MTKKELEIIAEEQHHLLNELQSVISTFIGNVDGVMKQSSQMSPAELGKNLSNLITSLELETTQCQNKQQQLIHA